MSLFLTEMSLADRVTINNKHISNAIFDRRAVPDPLGGLILMGKRELIALLNLSSWCLVMVERLFLMMSRGCLQFVIVVFPDHTHLLFFF